MGADLNSPICDSECIISEALADIPEAQALGTQAAAQAALLDLAHDAIMVREADHRLTYWDQGAQRTFGWARDEALGRRSYEFLRTEFPPPSKRSRQFWIVTATRKANWCKRLAMAAR
jgi:PAS domain-containing protein